VSEAVTAFHSGARRQDVVALNEFVGRVGAAAVAGVRLVDKYRRLADGRTSRSAGAAFLLDATLAPAVCHGRLLATVIRRQGRILRAS
jgi:hypothetical protein